MFDIVSSVKQGCILSPFLFLMVIEFVMRKTMESKDLGISWDHRRLADLDFADDLALLDHNHGALQDMTNGLHGLEKKVGQRISNGKTKTMTVGKHVMPLITLDNQNIENVQKSQFLESYMAQDKDVEVDIRTRIGKASSVFQHLQPIWKCRAMHGDQITAIFFDLSSNSNLCRRNMEDNSKSYQDD